MRGKRGEEEQRGDDKGIGPHHFSDLSYASGYIINLYILYPPLLILCCFSDISVVKPPKRR
jgi:hypothetical protein